MENTYLIVTVVQPIHVTMVAVYANHIHTNLSVTICIHMRIRTSIHINTYNTYTFVYLIVTVVQPVHVTMVVVYVNLWPILEGGL
jgi:hypothetical protein